MKKIANIFMVLIAATITARTQIPNNGFEQWRTSQAKSGNNVEIPSGIWVTNDTMARGAFVPVTKSTDHYPAGIGNYSLRMENNVSLLGTDSGAAAYGYSTTAFWPGYNGPAFPITGHPTSLCGYYKFLPMNNDTMDIGVGLFKNGAMVAGAVLTGTDAVPNWTSFNIPISNYDTADSAQIGLAAFYSKFGTFPFGPYGNSILYVDNLSFDNLITSVPFSATQIPGKFSLAQNYPNPFNPSTRFDYQLGYPSQVRLAVYDVLGRQVAELVNEAKQQGSYSATWNAEGVASGVYLCRMQAGSFLQTIKLVVMK